MNLTFMGAKKWYIPVHNMHSGKFFLKHQGKTLLIEFFSFYLVNCRVSILLRAVKLVTGLYDGLSAW